MITNVNALIVPYEDKYLEEILSYQKDLFSLNFNDTKFTERDNFLHDIADMYKIYKDSAFVLVNDDKVVGFYIYFIAFDAVLTQIYVVPGYREKGFGKLLMEHYEKHALEADSFVSGYVLQVSAINEQAVNFYRKLGYETIDEFKEQGEKRYCLGKKTNY